MDGELVVAFVRLADPIHGADRARWFLEMDLGSLNRRAAPLFDRLAEVEAWCPSRQAAEP